MIKLNDSIQGSIVKLSQGNPGALRVLCDVFQSDPVMGFMRVLDIDDMGMAGPSIWIAYKDFAKQDLARFLQALKDRDPEMVRVVNMNGGSAACGGKS